jgi:hypothetical protein
MAVTNMFTLIHSQTTLFPLAPTLKQTPKTLTTSQIIAEILHTEEFEATLFKKTKK